MIRENSSLTNRRADIDFIKGFSIVTVVCGHLGIPTILRDWIYIFHMPIFFFISGYLHKRKDNENIENAICSKAKTLIWPYYILGILYIVRNVLIELLKNSFTWEAFGKKVLALLYGNYIWDNNANYIGVLWFLAALFMVNVLFELILKVSDYNKKIISVLSLFTFTFGWIISIGINYTRQYTKSNSGYRLPYCLDIALVALIFYVVGWLVKETNLINQINMLLSICGVVIGSGLGYINKKISGNCVDMLYLRFGNPILFLMAALLLSIGLFSGSYNLYKMKFRMKMVESLGKNSLLIMALHLPLDMFIKMGLKYIGCLNLYTNIIVLILASWILAIIIAKWLPWIYKYPFDTKK